MPTTRRTPAPPVTGAPDDADAAVLDRLRPVAAGHPDVRRHSQARRQVLPRADRVTTVTGGWALERVLAAGTHVESALWCPGEGRAADDPAAAAAVVRVAGRAHRISERTLARLHPGLAAPSLAALVRLPAWEPRVVLAGGARLVLVADGIEYAGNLGTLIRTADACAADALVLTSATARVTHPKTFVASRGTVLTMPVLEYAEVGQAHRDLAAAGFTAFLADPDGGTSYREAGLGEGPTAVVVGSEGRGLCEAWRRDGLARVSIPMRGEADSLNVAVSAAVLLFEARAALDQQ